MAAASSNERKNISKQLLLVLLFILSCICLSTAINTANARNDSGLAFDHGVYYVPLTPDANSDTVYIGNNLVFVPNVDYTDIDSGEFDFYDYAQMPHATGVTVSSTYGWNDLGPNVTWYNCSEPPQMRVINREGKDKHCGLYIMTLHFKDPDGTYYLSIPHSNGLVKVYCNGNNLGFLWGRHDEWTPSFGFGYEYVPIIPDSDGIARVMITISTHVNIHNPGLLSPPALDSSVDSMSYAIIPALWVMMLFVLYLFILIGGFLISRTFKNKLVFYELILIEFLSLMYMLVDCNFIVFNAYVKEQISFILLILLNTMVFVFIDSFYTTSVAYKKHFILRAAPVIVSSIAFLLILWAIFGNIQFTTWIPLVPELLFTLLVACICGFNLLTVYYGETASFYVCIIEICHIFFSFNAIAGFKGAYNLPTYSVFLAIANLTLEFYYVSRYVIQARALEDTMEHMQFLVQEKTLRISEINRDLYTTNKKLMENEQARKTVLSNVSHDLRTPITAIRGYAEMLYTSGQNMPESQKTNYLKNIIRRSEQMERIISDIVELTRLESNANEFQFMDVSISELLDEVYMIYEADLQGSGKKITLDIPDNDLLFVRADPKKLSRVFENLISNAINYTFEEAKIEIKAWREGKEKSIENQTICIDIKDNGIGIPANEVSMIFDRFYRAKNSGQNIKGTGIGLSIVKTIIDRHDAKISVESAIGTGTVFHIVMRAN